MTTPAVLFYTSDFLTGVSNLTMEERGQYITLLCLQHQTGRLSKKTIDLCVQNISQDVLKKFEKDSKENYYNKRMEIETKKRENFIESRQKNSLKGGRPIGSKGKTKETTRLILKNHMDNDNDNDNEDINNSKISNKIVKEKYGKFNNVELSNNELDKLKEQFSDYEFKIDNLSIYLESTGKKYKSHYATILAWSRNDEIKSKEKVGIKNELGEL